MEVIKEKKPKGIIFLGGCFSNSQEKLEQLDIPFVLSTIASTEQMDENGFPVSLWMIWRKATKWSAILAVRVTKGLESWPPPPDDESIGKLRLLGYQKALFDHNITPDPGGFLQ